MKCQRPEPDADPAVPAIERILKAAATADSDPIAARRRTAVANALWICACVSEFDAPIWLIYDTSDSDLEWCRVPAGTEPLDLVDARHYAGGHAEPAEVLRWLRGDATDPWLGFGAGVGDAQVTARLSQKIRDRA